jgi:hypothetical protein
MLALRCPARRLSFPLVGLALIAAVMGHSGSAHASGPCADPNNKCPNGGLVTFPQDTAAPTNQSSGPCADPSNNCPNGGLVPISYQPTSPINQHGFPQTGGQPANHQQSSQPQTANQPSQASAANPASIAGHYQCSSELLVNFGSQWCQGIEPILALNDDGTYTWGAESGTYNYDGTSVAFSGSLGSGTVQNRLLIIDSQTTDPTSGASMTVRYRYIRMNY